MMAASRDKPGALRPAMTAAGLSKDEQEKIEFAIELLKPQEEELKRLFL